MSLEQLTTRLDRLPRAGVTRLPTPLLPLRRLSAHVGGPQLWAKREDLTGDGGRGNKLRKLDVVLPETLASGADTLVSGGVVQSNSQWQVAAAAMMGLRCHLVVLHGRVTPPGDAYGRPGNALLNRLFGAQLHAVPWTGDRRAALDELADVLRRQGRKPYVVPDGVSLAACNDPRSR